MNKYFVKDVQYNLISSNYNREPNINYGENSQIFITIIWLANIISTISQPAVLDIQFNLITIFKPR